MKPNKTPQYRFTKDFQIVGVKVAKGIVITNITKHGNLFSVPGSEIFKNIPEDYFEEYTPMQYKKVIKKKNIDDVKPNQNASDSARVSSNKELLKAPEEISEEPI